MAIEYTAKWKYWQEKINEYENNGNGKSQKEWCRENNIGSRRFNYWYCKLKNIEEYKINSEITKEDENNQLKWIPIEVEEGYESKNNTSGIAINIGKARIEINKGFDSESLINVVKVVNLLC